MIPAELRAAASAPSLLDGQPIAHLYLTPHRRPLPRGRVQIVGRAGPLGQSHHQHCLTRPHDQNL